MIEKNKKDKRNVNVGNVQEIGIVLITLESRVYMCDLLDIWLKKEIEHKSEIFDYLKENSCDDFIVDTALGMIQNIDATIKQIHFLKSNFVEEGKNA